VGRLRDAVPQDRFEEAWRDGETMSLEEAVASASATT